MVWGAKYQLEKLFNESLKITFPEELDVDPAIAPCQNPKLGDYQCNNAMGLWAKVKGKGTQFRGPQQIGQAIIESLPKSDVIESLSIAGPGFVNVKLSNHWIAESIHKMLVHGIEIWAPKLPVKRALVDFSSPNIAKEMHVGHLRSTIIGDTLARMLEYSNVEVLRRNHVGDWGTLFGMLIEYLFEKVHYSKVNDLTIGDLETFYKASNLRYYSDPVFEEKAQQAVVSLQTGDKRYLDAWSHICEISRKEFEKVYQRLGVDLEEKGESYYNPFIPLALEQLRGKGLIKKDKKGADAIFIEEKKSSLTVVKSNGGYNYASTDLTALWYRLNVEKAEWILYVTDVGQSEHFEKFLTVGKQAGWYSDEDKRYPKVSHVIFGLVLGEDGKKLRTRSSETVKLVDLLDEAKSRCKAALIERGKHNEWTAEELEKTAEAVGYGAVKYYELKNNRTTNYTFNYDQMLSDKVWCNTAVNLVYAHARICSIIEKSGKDIEKLNKTGKLDLINSHERMLGLHVAQFPEAVEEVWKNLLPNVLCEYLYKLTECFNKFYTDCQVIRSAEEESRLLLCEATAVVMRQCFYLLGITPVYKL
ncbi:hypothetical protein CASFOL_004366 [Castilleja foliolosa]|uniref:arginine--tRNA ligase n=1 Tax=Castilleja foliolosa TaxID=1961234 RepID=A0ABD3EEC5_9LAMI